GVHTPALKGGDDVASRNVENLQFLARERLLHQYDAEVFIFCAAGRMAELSAHELLDLRDAGPFTRPDGDRLIPVLAAAVAHEADHTLGRHAALHSQRIVRVGRPDDLDLARLERLAHLLAGR